MPNAAQRKQLAEERELKTRLIEELFQQLRQCGQHDAVHVHDPEGGQDYLDIEFEEKDYRITLTGPL